MKKVSLFLVLLMLLNGLIAAEKKDETKINWISIDELKIAYAKEPRPIIIDVYTSWCGWCKVMDKETYGDKKVAAYINANYYAVKFDAESTEPVEWDSKQYTYNSYQKVHGLATFLLFGQMGYPTTVLLSAIHAQPAPIPGFMKPSQLEAPLKYFGDGIYKNTDFAVFIKDFKASW